MITETIRSVPWYRSVWRCDTIRRARESERERERGEEVVGGGGGGGAERERRRESLYDLFIPRYDNQI